MRGSASAGFAGCRPFPALRRPQEHATHAQHICALPKQSQRHSPLPARSHFPKLRENRMQQIPKTKAGSRCVCAKQL